MSRAGNSYLTYFGLTNLLFFVVWYHIIIKIETLACVFSWNDSKLEVLDKSYYIGCYNCNH